MSGDNRRFPTWQWLVGVLLLLLCAAVGTITTIAAYAYQDTQKKIELKADRDDVVEMKQDMREMRLMMESHIAATGAGSIPERRHK